eukprot:775488_1
MDLDNGMAMYKPSAAILTDMQRKQSDLPTSTTDDTEGRTNRKINKLVVLDYVVLIQTLGALAIALASLASLSWLTYSANILGSGVTVYFGLLKMGTGPDSVISISDACSVTGWAMQACEQGLEANKVVLAFVILAILCSTIWIALFVQQKLFRVNKVWWPRLQLVLLWAATICSFIGWVVFVAVSKPKFRFWFPHLHLGDGWAFAMASFVLWMISAAIETGLFVREPRALYAL